MPAREHRHRRDTKQTVDRMTQPATVSATQEPVQWLMTRVATMADEGVCMNPTARALLGQSDHCPDPPLQHADEC